MAYFLKYRVLDLLDLRVVKIVVWSRAVACGDGAQAVLDDWSRTQKLINGGARDWYLGSGSTDIVCGESELYKYYNGF